MVEAADGGVVVAGAEFGVSGGGVCVAAGVLEGVGCGLGPGGGGDAPGVVGVGGGVGLGAVGEGYDGAQRVGDTPPFSNQPVLEILRYREGAGFSSLPGCGWLECNNLDMPSLIPPFTSATLEGVCRIIGDLYSGSVLTRIIAEVPLNDDPGEGVTKWRRLAHAVSSHQSRHGNGKALIKLVTVAMSPDRTLDIKVKADIARDELTQLLALSGYKVRSDGKVGSVDRATTDTDALNRTNHLRSLLELRGTHPDVVTYCRPDLLRTDFYEAVFEAIKGLGSRLRKMTGIDEDGYKLVEQSMAGPNPVLLINQCRTRTERNEQLGIANLAKGLFSAFRNPAAHDPSIQWSMTEQDALDVLGTLSLVHRRLDNARLQV